MISLVIMTSQTKALCFYVTNEHQTIGAVLTDMCVFDAHEEIMPFFEVVQTRTILELEPCTLDFAHYNLT